MKRRSLILISIVILAGAGSYLYFKETSYFYIDSSIGALRVANIASEKGDPSLCGKIRIDPSATYHGSSQASLISECYFSLAIINQDSEICNFISDYKDYAKPDFYRAQCIIESKNDLHPILCRKLMDPKKIGECYQEQMATDISRWENKDKQN